MSEYLLKYFPYEDFIIYEIGAGNGTLALDILDCIQKEYPEVYDRTRYHIIEISSSLAQQQKKRLSQRHPCAKVTHKSIFRWNIREPAPCFLVAMEVIVSLTINVKSAITDPSGTGQLCSRRCEVRPTDATTVSRNSHDRQRRRI